MPKNQRKPKFAPVKGETAMSRIITYSKDQARGAIRNRYGKRGGLQQVMTDVKELRKLLNTEEKHIDTIIGATTVSFTASNIILIGTVAEGSDSNQRTGRSIKIVRTDLLFYFNFSSGTVATSSQQNQYFNWYYIKYTKTPSSSGGSIFSIAEFLNQDAGSNYTPMSLPNPDNNENFVILASGQQEVELTVETGVTSVRFKIQQIQSERSFHQTYNGTASTNICDNCTFLVVTALQPANTGGISQYAASIRQWYIDN
jgi:hypothetical protein